MTCGKLKYFLSLLGLLALLALLPASVSAQELFPSSWQSLKQDLYKLRDESKSLVLQIETLQSDNRELSLSLQEQQEISQQQGQRLNESMSSLTESLRQSTSLREHIERLMVSETRQKRIWQIGIPVSMAVGFMLGVLLDEPD